MVNSKIIELSSDKKRILVECVQNGLKEFMLRNQAEALQEQNGIGLYALNYIFKHIGNVDSSLFDAFHFKRGPFEFKFLFDKGAEAIITFTSKNVSRSLSNRKVVKRPHYNDAFVLYNSKNFEEPKQLCFFENENTDEDARKQILQDIQAKIGELNPKYHIMIVYDLAYRDYKLKDIVAEMWSPHYYLIARERLGYYISFDRDNEAEDMTENSAYTADNTKVKNRQRFGLKKKEKTGEI